MLGDRSYGVALLVLLIAVSLWRMLEAFCILHDRDKGIGWGGALFFSAGCLISVYWFGKNDDDNCP